jgi:hypothetical protein
MNLEIAQPHSTDAPIVVGTARYVLLPLANLLTGYSVKAVRSNGVIGRKVKFGSARLTATSSSTCWVISVGLKVQRRRWHRIQGD